LRSICGTTTSICGTTTSICGSAANKPLTGNGFVGKAGIHFPAIGTPHLWHPGNVRWNSAFVIYITPVFSY
jgi:hypothetical protein